MAIYHRSVADREAIAREGQRERTMETYSFEVGRDVMK